MKKNLLNHFIRKKISKIIRKKNIPKNIKILMPRLKTILRLTTLMQKKQQILHIRMNEVLMKAIHLIQNIALNMKIKIIRI